MILITIPKKHYHLVIQSDKEILLRIVFRIYNDVSSNSNLTDLNIGPLDN